MGKQRSIGIFLLLSMLLSVLATCAQAVDMVDIEGFAFQPATLTVPPGTTVKWTNQDNAPHTVTSIDGKFDSGSLNKGQEFSFNFTEPGVYDYYCKIHPSMRGQIEVTSAKAAVSPIAAATEQEAKANQTSAPYGAGQQQPGFGAALALVAVLAIASLLQRKV
ncbi:MAG TPA: cupredoxin family copper-binding protein [Methanotrichaceae archaeon]|nr:cupredoxin family copper-binding protein [Methanotrichaceae archaeon]